jgi:quercetin dioxygenase-like cupin family protein
MREDSGDAERGNAGGPVPFVVAPGEGMTIQGPAGGPLTFKARGEQTDAALTVFENAIAPGDGPPLHTHAGEDESWYVLAGELRFRLGDDVATAPAGSFVFVPRGTPHCFQNVGAQPARIIVIFTPSGMERFFDRFAALPAGAVDPDAFASIGAEVGMDVVGPPMAVTHPA